MREMIVIDDLEADWKPITPEVFAEIVKHPVRYIGGVSFIQVTETKPRCTTRLRKTSARWWGDK